MRVCINSKMWICMAKLFPQTQIQQALPLSRGNPPGTYFSLACPWFVPFSPCLHSFSLVCFQFVVGHPCHSSPSPTHTEPHPPTYPFSHHACLHSLIIVCTPLHLIAFVFGCLGLSAFIQAWVGLSGLRFVCAHPVFVSSVCSTLPVKAILLFFKRKLYLPLHLRLKIPIKQMNS